MSIIVARPHINSTAISLAPEIDLILQCASSKGAQQNKARIESLLESKIDWAYLLKMCTRHKVSTLVHFNLDKIASAAIPQDIRTTFVQFYQINIQKNLLLTAELLNILKLCRKHQITAVPLKGAVLAQQAYSNFGLRIVSDIDIVVREADFAQTQKILTLSGYQAHPQNNPQRVRQAQYNKPNTLLCVDLHYAFSPKNHFISVDSARFWDNLTTFSLANQKIFVFRPVYMAIYLCLEGAKEHWRTLNRICDLSELVCSHSLDWSELLEVSQAMGRKITVCLGLYLAHTLLNTPIPHQVWTEIENNLRVKLSQQEICDFLFRPDFDLSLAFRWHSFNLQGFESVNHKLKYLRWVIALNLKTRFSLARSRR